MTEPLTLPNWAKKRTPAPGRDLSGKVKSGPEWYESSLAAHRTRGKTFKRPRPYLRTCAWCKAAFEGLKLQRYCPPPARCRRRAAEARARKYRGEVHNRHAPWQRLRTQDRWLLPLRNRAKDPSAYDPAHSWFEQPEPSPGLTIGLSDQLEDALARVLRLPLDRYKRAIGDLSGPVYYGGKRSEVVYMLSGERLCHDLLLAALRGLHNEVRRPRDYSPWARLPWSRQKRKRRKKPKSLVASKAKARGEAKAPGSQSP